MRRNCKFEMKKIIVTELLYGITSSYLGTVTQGCVKVKQMCEKRA